MIIDQSASFSDDSPNEKNPSSRSQSIGWDFLKRTKISEKDEGPRLKKKKLSDEPQQHVCLKCGSTLSRGRDSYKIRHWEQMHKNEDPKLALELIVPSSHDDAKKLKLTKNASLDSQPNPPTNNDQEPITHHTTPSVIHDAIPSVVAGDQFTQKNIVGYLDNAKDIPTEDNSMAKIQSDINQLKLMVASLSLQQKGAPVNLKSTGDEGIRNAANIMEITHDDILVEILEDGCRVTCKPCKDYFLANPHMTTR